MSIQSTMKMWKYGLMLALLCIWSIPGLAVAGVAPPIPTGPFNASGAPSVPDYYTTANWANSPPLAKFVDTLPGLGSTKANNLGQFLSVAKPDIVTYPGSDYYEINLVEYKEQMHSDLPNKTLLRGYVQVNRGTNTAICGGAAQPACSAIHNTLTPDPAHYLGPSIVAQRDRPARIKFTNRLPVGPGGDLFIPVDTSVMGAGTGPASPGATRGQGSPCDNTVEPNTCASYTQNRADLHLHGGRTPWISDGTPHQWITPVEEVTPFTKGVSFANVPDMPDPGDGSMTYYYSNQQSARLMFYHDHAFGITRLNVYAGEAAGYVITDQWEQDLVTRGIIPPDQIPLIIQDKTFVDATPTPHPVSGVLTPKVRITDPLWNWGSAAPAANTDPTLNGARPPVTGDLWMPHVYMPAQTLAAGFDGVNPFGRWMYGPWFFPATDVTKGPVPNPYYDADCSSPIPAVFANCTTPGQPTLIPGTPNTSMGMEAFQDSAIVNGTAFPTLTVDPRAYRFRILNAASDRFQNLSFYKADPNEISPDTRPASRLTEVKMVEASESLAKENNWPLLWPIDGRDGGVPDPGVCSGSGASLTCPNFGPSFLQIGTEGGFLPQPVVINPQPITYNTDPTAFWVGNVDKMGLALGPAERADVIVDFSAYPGQTLILYNDAPAAWPARVEGYDYFTGAHDMRASGGYGTGGTYDTVTGEWENGTGPLVGYAPNTRTVMQVIVRSSTGTDPAYTFNPAALQAEFTPASPATPGLFAKAQEPIIVGQAAYSTTYPNSYFPPNFPWEGIAQINDNALQFVTLAGAPVIVPMEPKGIHDEMGSSFDPVYGRMSGNLAMQVPNPTTLNQLLILYGFADLPTETINNSTTVNISVIPNATTGFNSVNDGTQIWNISHNGVDTHPIHFHIFDVQLINRVGWDGQILMPEPNELGWKDTVKISPLENTIVAVRPRAPLLPFGINNSQRPLNPAIPINSPMGFTSIDWTTGEAYVAPSPYAGGVTNILYNFGWEYVWHCHILSHEEMDMMRPIVLNVVSTIPTAPNLTSSAFSGSSVNLTWIDPTPVASPTTLGNTSNEVGVRIQRCTGAACTNFATIATAMANATSYKDFTISQSTIYRYQLQAFNAAGDSIFSGTATVTTAATIPPTVAITAPVNGSTFNFGETITINATATVRSPLTITNVQFLDGATVLATDTTAPYSFTWTGATAGVHSLTARVTPSTGAAVTSAAVSVTVTIPPPPVAPTLVSPTGSGITTTPAFTFNAVAGATGYQLYLQNNTTSTGGASAVFTPAQAGCPAGTGICSITLPTPLLNNNSYSWVASALNAGSQGPWSTGLNFTVGNPVLPPALTITSPTGSGITTTPAFTFNAVAGATGYQLYLQNNTTS
ncbi:MAG: multicopper oxidase domain-containing protein, partial [Desulfuromonadales bacterium]|nr:multicopper oxidase domain-containing protein [Desulfuromonadales bacterium]